MDILGTGKSLTLVVILVVLFLLLPVIAYSISAIKNRNLKNTSTPPEPGAGVILDEGDETENSKSFSDMNKKNTFEK